MHGPDPQSPRAFGWPAGILAVITAGYTGVLVWATHHPKPQSIVGSNPPSDKLLHVWAYAVLGLLVALSLAAAGRLSRRAVLTAAAGLAVFAALDEATQPLPWFRRTADPVDWLFDVAGLGLGMIVVMAGAGGFRGRHAAGPNGDVSSSAWERGSRPDSPT